MQDMGLKNISDAVQFLLSSALENQISDTKSSHNKIQKIAASYATMAYSLIKKFLCTSVKNGQTLANEAHDKAEKLIGSLISKIPIT